MTIRVVGTTLIGTAAERAAIVPEQFRGLFYETDTQVLQASNLAGNAWAAVLAIAAPHDLLSVSHGDTDPQAVTRGSIIYGNVTPEWTELVIGNPGDVLVVNVGGTEPEWAAGGGAAHNLLSATHPDTDPQVVTRGSLIVGDSTPEWTELVVGAANEVLTNNGVDTFWSAGALDLTAGFNLTVEAASLVNQDLTTDASVTFADVFVPDGGTFGIIGNELLTVNAAGNFTFSGITSIIVPDGAWLGADSDCSWLYNSTDGRVSTADKVGIGTVAPTVPFQIDKDTNLASASSFASTLVATSDDPGTLAMFGLFGADGTVGGATFNGYKARGTVGTPVITQAGDGLFQVTAYGYDNAEATTDYKYASSVKFSRDAGAGSEFRIPGKIEFRTAPGGGSEDIITRVTIEADGTVTIADLAGAGNRAVIADANGVLSAP